MPLCTSMPQHTARLIGISTPKQVHPRSCFPRSSKDSEAEPASEKSQLYKDVVLHFLKGNSYSKYPLNPCSQRNFLKHVAAFGNVVGVKPGNDEFDPDSDGLSLPSEVELRNGAQFVVVTTSTDNLGKRIESLEGWNATQTAVYERQLVAVAMAYLVEMGHQKDTVLPLCDKKIFGPNGKFREIDAGAIAENCVVVVKYKNKIDKDAALQLASAVDFINHYKESMDKFKGKQIYGLLAGHMQTNNIANKKEMDTILQAEGLEKRFIQASYAPNPCSPFETSQTFPCCGTPDGSDASP